MWIATFVVCRAKTLVRFVCPQPTLHKCLECRASLQAQDVFRKWLIDHPPEQELQCSLHDVCAAEVLAQTVEQHPGYACVSP